MVSEARHPHSKEENQSDETSSFENKLKLAMLTDDLAPPDDPLTAELLKRRSRTTDANKDRSSSRRERKVSGSDISGSERAENPPKSTE